MAGTPGIKSVAQSAFAAAGHYDRYRPSFPIESVRRLLNGLRVSGKNGATIVDLGAGTGKFTELLAQRREAYKIIAVEPHDDMRKQLEAKNLKKVIVCKGYAADMPVKDCSVDAVIASQSFHWFANEDTLKEAKRVLRPNKCLGMIWNIEDYNQPKDWKPTMPYEAQLKKLIWSLDDKEDRFRHNKWREVFEQQAERAASAFERPTFKYPLQEDAVRFTTQLSKEDVWNRMRSLSHIANSSEDEQKQIRDRVLKILSAEGVENEEGLVGIHGNTFIAWAQAM